MQSKIIDASIGCHQCQTLLLPPSPWGLHGTPFSAQKAQVPGGWPVPTSHLSLLCLPGTVRTPGTLPVWSQNGEISGTAPDRTHDILEEPLHGPEGSPIQGTVDGGVVGSSPLCL